ncbi:phage tail protein [Marixanthomonas spongiae]|uniref:Glycerol acyltransferase n=1 Tax=Marixanthomonas spongiae TaxID=2174845 RepID=A0A2U0HWI1_9FLAO|nr:phage tail protein [Marixanthomonas spongiae]PVW13196.1 glycerol acyltransferase [Marixanthomonas spongiae]
MRPPRKTYPPLNMHFVVEFEGQKSISDGQFQSVQGLQARICTKEDSKERKVHFENIVLKRAYQPNSKLIAWCMDAINNHKKQPRNLLIKLLNAQHEPISAWEIEQAVPVGWGVEELHAQDTKILLECIELDYKYFQVIDGDGNVIAPIEDEKETFFEHK